MVKYEWYEVLKPEAVEHADYIAVCLTDAVQVLKHEDYITGATVSYDRHNDMLVESNNPIVLDSRYLKLDDEGYVVI